MSEGKIEMAGTIGDIAFCILEEEDFLQPRRTILKKSRFQLSFYVKKGHLLYGKCYADWEVKSQGLILKKHSGEPQGYAVVPEIGSRRKSGCWSLTYYFEKMNEAMRYLYLFGRKIDSLGKIL